MPEKTVFLISEVRPNRFQRQPLRAQIDLNSAECYNYLIYFISSKQTNPTIEFLATKSYEENVYILTFFLSYSFFFFSIVKFLSDHFHFKVELT